MNKRTESFESQKKSKPLKLIIGLGNTGEKYKNNRHNAGFMFLDSITSVIGPFSSNKKYYCEMTEIFGTRIILIKPTTLMNSSGKAAKALFGYFKVKIDDLVVVHDDLDLRLGEYKIQMRTGPKLHNGVESIENALSDKNFWRVRIGVDNRERENRTQGERYVLEDFSVQEKGVLNDVFDRILDELKKRELI